MTTIKDLAIPDELLAQIELRARLHGVTVDQQVVSDLTVVHERNAVDEEALLTVIRQEREKMAARGVFLTDELLCEAKNWAGSDRR
jgi:hypothetical protein